MICDECGQREATVTLTVVQGTERTLRNLCPECMRRMSNAKGMLSAIFAAAMANMAALAQQRPAETEVEESLEEEALPDKTCERCGMTYAAFKQSGRLGCPGCYEAFREELQPMLQQLHGRTQHAGRQPLQTEAARRTRSRQEELHRLMSEAVQREDFEQAAALRDELRAMAREAAE
ncbi:MAG: UvrB/UvrC motif-containing protein [Clostridia bacterium]|nr:UvrB/UvrC motif-containing protein [Clostridia bacterium]